MKKLLSLLVVSLFALSFVAAAINVDSPTSGGTYSDEIQVSWTDTGDSFTYSILTAQGDCDKDDDWSLYGTYGALNQPIIMDVSEWEEADDYCVAVVAGENPGWIILLGEGEQYEIVNGITIDRTSPSVEIIGIGNVPDPNEKDIKAKVVYGYNDNFGVVSCEIDWGDGRPNTDCLGATQKLHQYKQNGEYTVTITVEDDAGNVASDSAVVSVENVAPWNVQVHSVQTVAALNEMVRFKATAEDVDADLPLEYKWIVDGEEVAGSISAMGDPYLDYRWLNASIHEVIVCAFDGDDETCSDALEMTIEEPEHMTPMQKAIAEKPFKFDLDEPWKVPSNKRFETIISGITSCELISGPATMVVSPYDGNRCQVDWTPTNDERGVWALDSEDQNPVIIKASNGVDYKYYSFDVTVYSWGIELVPGWNLISIPLMPASTSINDVFDSIYEDVSYIDGSTATVFQYDALEGKWYKARRYSPSATTRGFTWSPSGDKVSNIVPGYAYWIKMENAATLYGSEDMFPVSTTPGSSGINLATGSWNLIGRFGITPNSLGWQQALKSLRNEFYTDDYVSPTLGIYELLSVTASGSTTWQPTTQLKVGDGYWVRTSAGSEQRETVVYEPNTI